MEDLRDFVSPARRVGHPLVLHDETGSTNDDARTLAAGGCPHGTLVVADRQRAGRGRRGRPWVSPPGENLYVSLVLRPQLHPVLGGTLALVAGLAVAEAVEPFAGGRSVAIKWPNDVRLEGRKLAGVLVEGCLRGEEFAFVVVGIGINVRGAAPPEGLADLATTLRLARGTDLSRAEVLRSLVLSLERRFEALEAQGFADLRAAIAARCETLGRTVTIEGRSGVAEGIEPDGALRLRTADGEAVVVRSGEVA